MKRRLFWLLAIGGAIWFYLRRGARQPQPVDRVPPASDPADELRRKLDETKDRGADEPDSHLATPESSDVEPPHSEPAEPVEPPAPAEPGQPSAPVVSEDLEARRREIHEQARSAADDMRGTSSD
jgi:hypothetical protein